MFDRLLGRTPAEPAHDAPVAIPNLDAVRREAAADTLRMLARLMREAVPDLPIGEVHKDRYNRLTLRMVLAPEDARLAYLGAPDWRTDPSAEAARAAVNLMFLSKAPESDEREAAMETERRILLEAQTWRLAKAKGMA